MGDIKWSKSLLELQRLHQDMLRTAHHPYVRYKPSFGLPQDVVGVHDFNRPQFSQILDDDSMSFGIATVGIATHDKESFTKYRATYKVKDNLEITSLPSL